MRPVKPLIGMEGSANGGNLGTAATPAAGGGKATGHGGRVAAHAGLPPAATGERALVEEPPLDVADLGIPFRQGAAAADVRGEQ